MTNDLITTKTPIKYWGGKQQLAPRIIQLIPEHRAYIEPFFGGGAVFFAKTKSKVEIINDISDNMVNFYKTIKRDFENLQREIEVTLYSEFQYKQAKELWKNGENKESVMRAWAVFLLSWQCFSGNIGNAWAYSDQKNCATTFDNMKKLFDEKYVQRLEHTQIFCRDALNVIKNTDHKDSFFFIDPPYYNAVMGCYDGYTLEDFTKLLDLLQGIKGNFLLTTYPSEILTQYTKSNAWKTISNRMHLSASNRAGRDKVEVFTMNY
ncbi:MAG: DNA adenine methylase [Chitinophagaceae bacterium]